MHGELRIQVSPQGIALNDPHRSRRGLEIDSVYYEKPIAFFNDGEEIKPQGAAVDKVNIRGEQIAIAQGFDGVDSYSFIAEKKVAYAKDRYFDYFDSFERKNL